MLVLAGQAVISDAKQGAKTNLEADFFPSFPYGALLKRFEEVHFAADNAPAAGFGRPIAKGEEDAALIVGQQNANANSWIKGLAHAAPQSVVAGAGSRRAGTKRSASANAPKNTEE